MVTYFLFRLFYNFLLGFIFVYIDVVIPGREGKNGGIVLVVIGIYSGITLSIKTILALIYHFKFMFIDRCCEKFKIN